MEQATISEFFTARKRPTEGIHAAKRRKTMKAETVQNEMVIGTRRSSRIAKNARCEKTSRATKGATRSRTRTRVLSTKSQPSPAPDSDLQEFLQKKLEKPALNDVEKPIGEITSVRDDHAFEDAVNGNTIAGANRRKDSVPLRNLEAKLSPEKVQNQIVSPRKIVSAVKVKRDGLKPNPWIAEQAMNVFLGRGGADVAPSRKMTDLDNKMSTREAPQKNKRELKPSKSNQDLEKARKLCETMRSLRTKGESAKELLTRDKSERLHDVASAAVTKETR